MHIKDLTKNMFADTLAEMLKEMPLDKVRVRKLCERCGTTSPTFYYYFRDKYELVVWIFLQDVTSAYTGSKSGSEKKGMEQVIGQIKNRKAFYQKAFTDQSQNSLGEYIQSFIIRYFMEATQRSAGKKPTESQIMLIKYHIYGLMGMFREWLFEQDTSFETKYRQLFDRAPDFLKRAFAVYPFTSENILRILDTHESTPAS